MAEGRVLIIAGSDSGGGAGIQADIKTVTALGGYAACAITAITVQDTLGVHAVHPVPAEVIVAQARSVLEDIGADAIKIGMIPSVEAAQAVARLLDEWPHIPAVIDPVISASGGAALSPAAGLGPLVARAALLTPNAPEAAALTGLAVTTQDEMRHAGAALIAAGARAALMKGGHIASDPVIDLLIDAAGEASFASPRLAGRHTHGTGCTLAAACAVGLAQGLSLADAVGRAHRYTFEAIRRAPGFGRGAGPLDHAWPLRP